MELEQTGFRGLYLLKPKVLSDSRGHFIEAFNSKLFVTLGIDAEFVQDNQSFSRKGVMRGLHFQKNPHAQSKLVRVVRGAIMDVVLDLRKREPTFGRIYTGILSADNMHQLFVPKGFAHGFAVIGDGAEVLYKCDAYYAPGSEAGINILDESLELSKLIPNQSYIVSDKDRSLPLFADSWYDF